MNAPLVRPAPRTPNGVPLAAGQAGPVEAFVVVREGAFGGEVYGVGDVLLCRGDARNGDATVLVATGVGRPRLGLRRNGRWLGDAGEPCAEERWRSAGRLVGRIRSTVNGPVVELRDLALPVDVPASVQLSLFAA